MWYFFSGAASKKKSGKKYYYYKCEKCKTYFSEEKVEDLLFDFFVAIQEHQNLFDEYYTPFIKSKLEDHTKEYLKELKELKDLDKQMDRIKTAYIKGILKIEDFDNDNDIKHIEFRKQELEKQIQEQKQYDNMNLTLDNLLIFEDKQRIDFLNNPSTYLDLIVNWIILSKNEKQKIISHYIDTITIERNGDDLVLV